MASDAVIGETTFFHREINKLQQTLPFLLHSIASSVNVRIVALWLGALGEVWMLKIAPNTQRRSGFSQSSRKVLAECPQRLSAKYYDSQFISRAHFRPADLNSNTVVFNKQCLPKKKLLSKLWILKLPNDASTVVVVLV